MGFNSFVKKKWKIILLFPILVLVVLLLLFRGNNNKVKTIKVARGNLKEVITLSGSVSAIRYAKLSFETSGKIVYVGVKEGENVKKGRLVSKIDSTVLNSNYQIALSNLRSYQATAENVLDQVKEHDKDESFAQKDLRTAAETGRDKAYEAVLIAKRNLEGASLYAPFDGIITYLAHPFVNVYTTTGAVEAEIIDPKTMYFKVLADQTEVIKIQKGQEVEISLDAFENQLFKGKVESVSFVPETNESGINYEIKVNFAGIDLENSKFKIAMTGDAKFVIAEKKDVFYLPNNFIKQDKEGKFLKINKRGDKLYIKTGVEGESETEVIGDITEGQMFFD